MAVEFLKIKPAAMQYGDIVLYKLDDVNNENRYEVLGVVDVFQGVNPTDLHKRVNVILHSVQSPTIQIDRKYSPDIPVCVLRFVPED